MTPPSTDELALLASEAEADLFAIIASEVRVMSTVAPGDGGSADLDCVVEGLDPLWPLRAPSTWRLRQFIHYDANAWCWVVEHDGSVLPIDTLDDPNGLSRLAFQTRDVFRFAGDDRRAAAIRGAFLASKRINKRDSDPAKWAQIRPLAAASPETFHHTLSDVLGPVVASDIAKSILDRHPPSSALLVRASAAQRHRRYRTFRRAVPALAMQTARVLGRAWSPTGLYVLIAGPDGTGKSTLANGLLVRTEGLFRSALHQHWAPGVLPSPARLLGRAPVDTSLPHGRTPHGKAVSLGLLGYHWLDFFVGEWTRILLCKMRTGLVVVERGWWDIAVDPLRYRLQVPAGLVIVLGRLLPSPDVVILLEAPATTALARKDELSASEVERQTKAWSRVAPVPRALSLDTSRPIEDVEARASGHVAEVLERRVMARLGAGWAAIPPTAKPRWFLPRGPRRVARAGLGLYQPITVRASVGWEFARAAAAFGGFRLLPRGQGPPPSVRDAVRPYLVRGGGLAVSRANHLGRFLALIVGPEGRPIVLVKVATSDTDRGRLAHEAEAIRRLGPLLHSPIAAPSVVAQENGVLVTQAADWVRRRRPWVLDGDVCRAMGGFYASGGRGGVRGPVHGDFAPWNLLRTGSGWLLVDWESAEAEGLPFFDLFHYLVQSHALLARPTREVLVGGIQGRGPVSCLIRAWGEGSGINPRDAPVWFRRYLCDSLETLEPAADGSARARGARISLLKEVSTAGLGGISP